jgi:hypothetical protein
LLEIIVGEVLADEADLAEATGRQMDAVKKTSGTRM